MGIQGVGFDWWVGGTSVFSLKNISSLLVILHFNRNKDNYLRSVYTNTMV